MIKFKKHIVNCVNLVTTNQNAQIIKFKNNITLNSSRERVWKPGKALVYQIEAEKEQLAPIHRFPLLKLSDKFCKIHEKIIQFHKDKSP